MSHRNRNPYMNPDILKRAAAEYSQRAGVGVVNTTHPGQNMGLSLDQVKDIIANSEKVQGVTFTSAAGEVTPAVKFPSTAKFLLGFSFSKIANVADSFNLNINEEKAITGGSAYAYSQKDGNSECAYYEFPRVIGGSTSLLLEYISAVGGESIVATFHYV